jgi:hypothetical protein
MWFDMWANSCDIFHRIVVAQEITLADVRIHSSSCIVRASCNFGDTTRSTTAFRNIRGIFEGLEFGTDKPAWDTIPILNLSNRGTKRKHTGE